MEPVVSEAIGNYLTVSPAAAMAVMTAAPAVVTAAIVMSAAGERGKAKTNHRLSIIHWGAGDVDGLNIGINSLRGGVINDLLLVNASRLLIYNGLLVNVNRFIRGLKRDTEAETIFAAAVSRY